MISTQIEITRSPVEVRKIFLDFPQLPTWTQGFITSIKPANPDGKLEAGERLNCNIGGMSFNPIILENSEREFRWRGRLFDMNGLFTGEHVFRFQPSKATPGGTTFVQEENFTGILSFLYASWSPMSKDATKGFSGFNADLKARCERE